jgi:transposase
VTRLFKNKIERKKGLWRRVVDLALTDVRVAAGGMDHTSLEDLEERLLAADFGVPATMRLVDRAEEALRRGKTRGASGVVDTLRTEIREILDGQDDAFLRAADSGPTVYLMVGVNGVGKTTSVAKLANHLIREGQTVMVAAADTFRAGQIGLAPTSCEGNKAVTPRRLRSMRSRRLRHVVRMCFSLIPPVACTPTAVLCKNSKRSIESSGAEFLGPLTRRSWCLMPRSDKTRSANSRPSSVLST